MKLEADLLTQAKHIYNVIQDQIQNLPLNEFLLSPDQESQLRSQKMSELISEHLKSTSPVIGQRLKEEFFSWGPLCSLFSNEGITEIMVNGRESIWYETKGQLYRHEDAFLSELSFRNFVDRISHEANAHITVEHPCADGRFQDFRLSLIGSELTRSEVHLCLRRHPKNPWTFSKLESSKWCGPSEIEFFKKLIAEKKNFLVIGPTGAGKTSVLNSFLNLLPEQERVLVIEDTPEIVLPNSASMKLLTREDPQGILNTIDQGQLVKRCLRLRPDRVVMGEVRGAEAKDFLMALATGHSGSFGTIHAEDPAQALIRLEMLIQMGAPQWSLQAIRRMIQLSLDYVIVAGRGASGERKFKGAFRLCSLEDHGLLLEAVSFS